MIVLTLEDTIELMVGRLYTKPKEKVLDLKLCFARLQNPHLQD